MNRGTMQGGVLAGDYTCDVHTGEGALDVYSLWSNREGMEYITYTGSFDSEGKILTEQPSEEIKKKLLEGTDYTDLVLYAYDATGENCLWQGNRRGYYRRGVSFWRGNDRTGDPSGNTRPMR